MTAIVSSLVTFLVGVLGTWITHKVWPGTPAAKPTVPAPVGPAAPSIAPGLTHLSIDWGIFTGLLNAIVGGKQSLVLDEVSHISKTIRDYGSAEAVIEDFVLTYLEAKLKDPTKKTVLLTAVARMLGISERQFLDAAEKKAASSAPVVSAIVGLALFFGLASSASAVSPLGPTYTAGPTYWNANAHAPQRFYATELNLIAEPVTRASALIGDCNLPDPGPSVFIDYFYADWCGDCAASKRYANELNRKGYNVIIRNAGNKDGAGYARACRVTSVPMWLVRSDGREELRTNDAWAVDAWLRNNKPVAAVAPQFVSAGLAYGPDGSCCQAGRPTYWTNYYGQQPVYFQQGNGPWYPGKLVVRHVRNGGWYPGKLIGRWLFRRG